VVIRRDVNDSLIVLDNGMSVVARTRSGVVNKDITCDLLYRYRSELGRKALLQSGRELESLARRIL
jgi:hypothetical protein